MLTQKNLEWLLTRSMKDSTQDRNKYTIYLKRVQESIDNVLEALLVISREKSFIITNDVEEILSLDTDKPIEPHKRLKMLLKIISTLQPDTKVWFEVQKEPIPKS